MFGKTTLNTKLAEHLAKTGGCYRRDLARYGMQFATEKRVQAVIKQCIQEEFFRVETVIKADRRKTDDSYSYIMLTRKGKTAYLDTIGEDEIYYRTHFEEKEKQFFTTNHDKLRIALRTSRIETMFAANGIPTAAVDKPSLTYLYGKLTGASQVLCNDTYKDTLPRAECAEVLEKGIFYTIKEFRDFLDNMENIGSDDTMYSRARGIYISNDKILVVFISEVGANKIIKISSTAEKRLLVKIKTLSKITQAYRKLPELSKKKRNPATGEMIVTQMVESHPYALVISDGDSLVYSMATGNPRGIIKGKDKMLVKDATVKNSKDNAWGNTTWLKGNGSVFPRVFVTPCTPYGIGSLGYLCHTSSEEWAVASRALFASSERFEIDSFDPIYPAYEKGEWSRKSIFMPVFEVNELYSIATAKYTPTFLTYSDMLNAISHSIRKETAYYNADTMEIFDPDEVIIYDEYGYPKGYHMLEEVLRQMGLQCAKKDLNALPALQGYTFNKFYNEVARGRIDIQLLIPSLPTKKLEQKEEEPKRFRTSVLGMRMGEKFINKIKKAAKLHDTTVSSYIKGLIHEQVNEDAELYDQRIREAKRKARVKE
ncbi:MAG: hypothetical protein IKF80_05770 [Erysipelotrichaceae bacterium]|nr:hypothetical protein [Erysipelotrichaceae bacterium]